MFMCDEPLAADLAQTDGQAKLEINFFSVRFRAGTAHQSCDKRDVAACRNVHLGKIKHDGVASPRKEQIPSSFVSFDSF